MYDFHMHPYHSADGQMSLREMILSAIEKGMVEICATPHYDVDFPPIPRMNFICDLIDYTEDVERYAKRFSDQITVRTGLEVGLQEGRKDIVMQTRRAMEGLRFDFTLCSVHWLASMRCGATGQRAPMY